MTRIRTDLNKNGFLPIQLVQKTGILEILSLRIDQSEFYKIFDASYGCIVGRVNVNGGFGIKNAKVSVFIPREATDTNKDLYPFENINDRYPSGKRYNLLPKDRENGKDPCYVPVGSMPNKNTLLDNPKWIEVFDRYYKYTTTTNDSGDFCLMGVPVGQQILHVDADLSDIGVFSLKPYDMIAQGVDDKLFTSNTKFKQSDELESLVNIYTVNKTIDVVPFWGQSGVSGINRCDINFPISVTPTSIVSFGVFTDERNFITNRNCRPRKKQGRNCNLETGEGNIEIIRRITENSQEIEYLSLNNFQINPDGVAVVPVPLNLKLKVTDEFGNLVDSFDGNGIPTEALIRMKVSMSGSENGTRNRTAKYLIPNLYNDFTFDSTTQDLDFFNVKFRSLYTVANYIPRIQKNKRDGDENHTGIKRIGNCESNLSIPYNRMSVNFNPLYSVICIILSMLVVILNIIETIVDAIPGIDFSFSLQCQGIEIEDLNDWKGCVLAAIAEELGVIDKKFYNDFLIGSLYFPKFRFKVRYKRRKDALYYKYCAFDCRDTGVPSDDPDWVNRCKRTYVVDDQEFNSSPSYFDSGEATEEINSPDGRGYVWRDAEESFYASRNDVEANSSHVGLDLVGDTSEKDKLLWATTLIPMGSLLECAPDGTPMILDRLVPTSHQDEETDRFLYDADDFGSCFVPNGVAEERIYGISQYGVDVLSEDEDDLTSGGFFLDSEEVEVREYLCHNFTPFANNFNYSLVSTVNVNDQDGNTFEVVTDECDCANNKPIRNITPYFHYWGLKKNKTALDYLRQNYLGNCE